MPAPPLIQCITQLANDMMANINLNALVNGDMYSMRIETQVREIRDMRRIVAEAVGGLQAAIRQGMLPASEFLPLNVCGTVSNIICKILWDNATPAYRFDFANRGREVGNPTDLVALSGALKGRSREKSYLLRVDCTSHSYTIYMPPTADDGYLMQGNAAECMDQFTLQEWMATAKAQTALSVRAHLDRLHAWAKQDTIGGGSSMYREVVATYSIDDDYVTRYNPFRPTSMEFMFREVKLSVVKRNLEDLYRRARIPAIPGVITALA